MSLTLKIFLILSFLNISHSSILLRQTKFSNDFFYDKEYAMIESQLYFYLYQFESMIPDNFKELVEKMVVYVARFWVKTQFLPSTMLFDEEFLNCAKEFVVLYNEEKKNDFYAYLENTGKLMNDFGNEHFCSLKEYNIYYLFRAFLVNATRMTNYEDVTLVKFIDQRCFYLGICLPQKCSSITNRIAKNKQFREFLYTNLYLNNLTLIDVKETKKNLNDNYETIGDALKLLIYIIFVIKFAISIGRSICMDKGYERWVFDRNEKIMSNREKEKENIIQDEEKKENEKKEESFHNKLELTKANNIRDSELREAYFEYIYGISSKEENNLYSPFHDMQDNFPIYIKIIKILDLIDNIKLLLSVSNKYYNSCGIKRIYILKILTIFMTISLKLMISQLEIPSKSFLVYNFYKDFSFFITKICIFSSVFWIVLDAMTAGFKLMSFLKKKIATSKDNKLSFLSFAQFFLLLIPKIILFILVYIILHLCSKHLIYSFSDPKHKAPFILYESNIGQTEYSFRHNGTYIKNIMPLWINYIDYFVKEDPNENKREINPNNINDTNEKINYTIFYEYDLSRYKVPSPFLTNTDLFINIYLNEFVILIFMIFIAYFSYRISNAIFDYVIFFINIVLYIIPLFNWTKYNIDDNSDEKYTLLHVLGQNFSEKYTHYFINFYYFGFILGVMFFYNNEIINYKLNKFDDSITINSMVSNNSSNDSFSMNNENIHLFLLPFSFCKKIISFLNNIKYYLKWIILCLSLVFIFLMSCTFYIIQEVHETTEECDKYIKDEFKLRIPKLNEPWIKFIFLYEKNLCCIFFFVFLLMFIVLSNNNFIIKFCNLNCFVIFERISFSTFCTYNFLVYMAFCVFYLDFKLTHINIILTTFGLFILLIIVNIFIVCSFELPFRIIIKSFMNKNLTKEFKKDNISGGLLAPSIRSTINSK